MPPAVSTEPAPAPVATVHRRTVAFTGGVAVGVGVVASLVGMGIDLAVSGTPGLGMGLLLGLAAAVATLAVRRSDLWVPVVMVPLIYLGTIAIAVLVDPDAGAGGGLLARLADVLLDFVLDAPIVLAATAAAFVLALLRRLSGGPVR